ncbi:hypothetical protein CTEN210_12624 [Chaetoceros tenuissimus]|uniref:Uncharacterized protein n=1 Tax=Chaetoceros tenuissimus TaxID=426638 RepID=A0AAD3HAN8_9STRA|nr:hypothetical protein CTEN210_12624 [Chaetoceros tenuissimus]
MGNNYSNNVSFSEAGSEEEWENVSNVDYCEDDDEVLLHDEDFIERLRILEDAKQLKQLAKMFMHPELPVEVDPAACARCYYDRASAPMQETKDDMEEKDILMEDIENLKRLAKDYLHPELPVEVDPAACARCYYDRASAPMQETKDDMKEKNMLMKDIENLKRLAKDYLHPELSAITSDPAACARCYYDRASAPMQETKEEMEEHDRVMADVAELRHLARDYLHPELSVITSDPAACARCYYDRASAPMQETKEEMEEHDRVMADVADLRRLARDYLHPELSVVTSDPSACARCYFDRASAPMQETKEEMEEHDRVLTDVAELRHLARDYLHPELSVVTSDPSACARCYYDRASAPMQETKEEMEEHGRVLTDVAELRHLACDYLHPELSVVTSDPSACARCYYDRASAPMQETKEEMEEHDRVMADVAELRHLACDYLHPELSVVTSDPSACARCYFDRASAPMQETKEEMEEHDRVLTDVAELRRLACDYLHPELSVVTSDPAACARCYFDRASATVQDSFEEAEQHHEVLVDALNLKSLAEKVKHLSISTNKVNPSTTLSAAEMAKNKVSVSSVNLYGLDDDFSDAALF